MRELELVYIFLLNLLGNLSCGGFFLLKFRTTGRKKDFPQGSA